MVENTENKPQWNKRASPDAAAAAGAAERMAAAEGLPVFGQGSCGEDVGGNDDVEDDVESMWTGRAPVHFCSNFSINKWSSLPVLPL